MKNVIMIAAALSISACASLSSDAQRLAVVDTGAAYAVADCERMGIYSGNGGGGMMGESNAKTDAINKAARNPGVDTVLIAGRKQGIMSSSATVIGYRCY